MQEITDGSAKFRVVDRRLKAMIDILYPVGIVVTTATDGALKPGEADGLATWEEIAQDRVLQGTENGAGNTIEAGLPNITGRLNNLRSTGGADTSEEGALFWITQENEWPNKAVEFKDRKYKSEAAINASRSSPIYGNSNTVQPPALKVHFWKRIK